MTATTVQAEKDPFDTADFAPERQIIPWLQVLNNEDEEKSGLFLTSENVENAGIKLHPDWKKFKAKFKSGEVNKATGKFEPATSEGVLFNKARMLIVRTGALNMYTKRKGNVGEEYLGLFNYEQYNEQKADIVCKTRYLLYLLSDENILLHEAPIQFTTRGVFGVTFSAGLRAFQTQLQRCYGKQRGDKFLINGVYVPKTATELRGTAPDTAWVSVVESHEVPTKENWKTEYFVGYNETVRNKLLADYETYADFDARVPQQEESSDNKITNSVTSTDPDTGQVTTVSSSASFGGTDLIDEDIPY